VRAATVGILPGAELFQTKPAKATTPPIIPTEFAPIAPVQPSSSIMPPPAAAAAVDPASFRPVLVPVYYAAQLSRPGAVAQSSSVLPHPHELFYGGSEALDLWPMSRLASSSAPARPSSDSGRGPLPPPPAPPLEQRLDRVQLTTWALLRAQDNGIAGSRSLASGGQLGASQAGARLFYNFTRQLAVVARLSSEVGRRGGEAAAGVRVRPLAGIPLWLTAERRQRIGQYGGGRNAFALFAEGGVYGTHLPAGFTMNGYLQGGVVGAKRRDLFVDGGMAVTRPLFRQFSGGLGVWGGAQPGVARLDAGPRLSMKVRGRFSVDVDWRQKLAGNARPGSGPAITLSGDF
jgi:hypothetical protein